MSENNCFIIAAEGGKGYSARRNLRNARVAHLLGSTLTAREKFVAKMKKLYRIRSSIAHSGSRQITAQDLGEMRMMCLFSLHALAVAP